MNWHRSVLRLLWPATLRNRLTLLVGASAFVLLAAIASAVAVQARASLLASTRQRIPNEAVFEQAVWAGKGNVPGMALWFDASPSSSIVQHTFIGITHKAHTGRVPPCTPHVLSAESLATQREAVCLAKGNTQRKSRDVFIGGEYDLVSEGNLLLLPWTDPVHGPVPIRRQATIAPAYTLDLVYIRSLRREQAHLNAVVWQLAAGTLGLTLVVAGTVWLAAGRVLRPVEAIRADFAELSAHHLDRRIAVPRAGREITRLADTMNTTLDRLQNSVEQQRQFTDDASHELRTPLACLRTELELALNHPDTADWPQVVHAAHDDTLRLQALTTDLLLLARLDAPPAAPPPSPPLDLTDLVRNETGRRTPPPHLTLTLHTAPEPIPVHGHHALLTRVLGNLLDNAERHATSTITVHLTRDTQHRHAVLEVLDDGPGIPPEDHQRIFERFSRLDDARARDDGGAGLGLAIAQRIATTHHGTLTLAPSPQGAHFLLHLPTSAGRR